MALPVSRERPAVVTFDSLVICNLRRLFAVPSFKLDNWPAVAADFLEIEATTLEVSTPWTPEQALCFRITSPAAVRVCVSPVLLPIYLVLPFRRNILSPLTPLPSLLRYDFFRSSPCWGTPRMSAKDFGRFRPSYRLPLHFGRGRYLVRMTRPYPLSLTRLRTAGSRCALFHFPARRLHRSRKQGRPTGS